MGKKISKSESIVSTPSSLPRTGTVSEREASAIHATPLLPKESHCAVKNELTPTKQKPAASVDSPESRVLAPLTPDLDSEQDPLTQKEQMDLIHAVNYASSGTVPKITIIIREAERGANVAASFCDDEMEVNLDDLHVSVQRRLQRMLIKVSNIIMFDLQEL
mmetsp:Transcript_3037/g.7907  ORF Transcript_3037/g.7907 Transcript_3037/m.7907 type:complete len:162 (+) Transcript_3037:242-727(+)